MQSVYAILQSNSENLNKEERFLRDSIDKMYDLYVLSLSIIIDVKQMASKHLEITKKKHLASSEDKNPNTKFTDNTFIAVLEQSASLKDYIEDNKLNNWKIDSEFVRIIWDLIRESAIYSKYIETRTSSFEDDKKFVLDVFKHIIAPNEKLADYFEDKNISWVDDIPFVNTWVVKTLNGMSASKAFILGDLYKDESDEKFVLELFRKVILNHEKYDEIINEKTPNWDSERIADIDLILIKMAISEFLHFPSIPTKVSINEYIELSKDYSSQKSSFFINGVLDKILKEFTEAKKIKKMGRGLL
jgi:N utilization substance protein B